MHTVVFYLIHFVKLLFFLCAFNNLGCFSCCPATATVLCLIPAPSKRTKTIPLPLQVHQFHQFVCLICDLHPNCPPLLIYVSACCLPTGSGGSQRCSFLARPVRMEVCAAPSLPITSAPIPPRPPCQSTLYPVKAQTSA